MRSAESIAANVSSDPLAREQERRDAFNKCQTLIRKARTLLLNDPNYLRSEAQSIVAEVVDGCWNRLFRSTSRTRSQAGEQMDSSPLQAARASLGLPVGKEAEEAKARYEAEVRQSLQLLSAVDASRDPPDEGVTQSDSLDL